MKNKRIRVLVVGDEGVGKTSWISSLLSLSINDQPEKVIGPVTLPPELCVQAHDMSTVLIDTSSNAEHQQQVSEEIKDANVILLFYDVQTPQTIENLKAKWLPLINKISSKIPVIIVGNKIDLLDDIRNEESNYQYSVQKVIIPLIKQFNQVEMGLECSAINQPNIKDIIYCCQRAVLFPLAPLYDISKKQLKPEFERALTRIFRICDKDLDGVWHDQELVDFQLEVFRGELTKHDVKGIKEIIREEISRDSIDRGITLEGFITLQKRCVELIKIQICWTILRHFGYDDQLELSGQMFQDEIIYDINSGQSIELAEDGIQFLKNQFNRFSQNNLLNINQFNDIFDPINKIPWKNIDRLIQLQDFFSIETENINQYNIQSNPQEINQQKKLVINLSSWIALWHYLVLQDHKEAFKFLKYIGYQNGLHECFNVTNKKSSFSQLMKLSRRNVFHICLIGPSKSGKSQILSQFLDKPFTNIYSPTNQKKTIIKPIQINGNANNKFKTLIITEIPENELQDFFNTQYNTIDLIGLVYDQEDTVKLFLEQHEELINQNIPRFIVKSKCDNQSSIQENLEMPQFLKGFSTQYTEVSSKNKNVQQNLTKIIFDIIEKPFRGLQEDYIRENDSFLRRQGNFLLYGFTATAVAGILYYFTFKPRGGFRSVFSKFFTKKQF